MPKTDHISSGAVKLIQERQLAHVTTLMPDGSPQVSIVWVDAEDDGSRILINTAEGRLKLKNVTRDPRIAVSVVDKANDFRFVEVRGRVEELDRAGGAAEIDKLSKKYTGRERYPGNERGEKRVTLRIKPEHVVERGV